MPFAKGVSAKTHEFDSAGNAVRTDYPRMMKIVLDAGYRGHVGIEWEGREPGEVVKRLTYRSYQRLRRIRRPWHLARDESRTRPHCTR